MMLLSWWLFWHWDIVTSRAGVILPVKCCGTSILRLVNWSIHPFCADWNISTTIGWIDIKFSEGIHITRASWKIHLHPLKYINISLSAGKKKLPPKTLNNFDDSVTFYLASPWDWRVVLSDVSWLDRSPCSPQDGVDAFTSLSAIFRQNVLFQSNSLVFLTKEKNPF